MAYIQEKTSGAKSGIILPRCGNCSMDYDGL
jgi:hypothetical protein